VASHLLSDPDRYLTPIGSFLRKRSRDELPQLLGILRGAMSFVGPRPALFNQHDLMVLRIRNKVDTLIPGLTGWAQLNGRDELPIPVKVCARCCCCCRRALSLVSISRYRKYQMVHSGFMGPFNYAHLPEP
jgi:O-antigen biosynthesis protein WbqP